jgi:Domain of unkown function (DUF1775)
MARRAMWLGCAVAALGLGLTAAAVQPALADVSVSPSEEPAGGSGILSFRVTDDIPDAGTTRFELDLPTDHPLLGVMPAEKIGWDMAVERSPLPGPAAGRVTRVIWAAASSATAIQPRRYATFSLSVLQFPTDTPVIRIRALQTWSNGDAVEWFDPALPGAPSPLHPAPQVTLIGAGTTTPMRSSAGPLMSQTPSATMSAASGTPGSTPIAAVPAGRSGPSTDRVDIALGLAGGAFVLALGAAVMAGWALFGGRAPASPDEA